MGYLVLVFLKKLLLFLMALKLTEFREYILALPEGLSDSERRKLLSEFLDKLPELELTEFRECILALPEDLSDSE
ncbi:MAG: hypothetical protein ACKO57_05945, partial [Alphaproteobacteria bacterium]